MLDGYQGTILLVSHDRYLIDALATQIWEVDPDESQMTAFKGTYSQLKEEREKQAARLAEQQAELAEARTSNDERKARNVKTKEERRKIAQLQELENTIAALEKQLADLTAQLENPPADAGVVAQLGKDYERVQRDMDEKLLEWETLS